MPQVAGPVPTVSDCSAPAAKLTMTALRIATAAPGSDAPWSESDPRERQRRSLGMSDVRKLSRVDAPETALTVVDAA